MGYTHGPFPTLQEAGQGQGTLGEQKQFRTGTDKIKAPPACWPLGTVGY